MDSHKQDHTHTHTYGGTMNLDIPIFIKICDFYKLLSQLLLSFPKSKRYTLGQRIDQISLATIELVITAGYTPREQKLALLQKTSIKIDLLKILLRLSLETKCIDNKKYQLIANHLVEIGKMVGGWIKSVKE